MYPLADRVLGGTLHDRLLGWRTEGRSLREMVELLAAEGIDVTSETVRRWCREEGIDTTGRASQ